MLPDANAEQGVNCDLPSGILKGLPQPEAIVDLRGASPIRDYIYQPTTPTSVFSGNDINGNSLILEPLVDSVLVFVNGSQLARRVDFSLTTDQVTLTQGTVTQNDIVDIMVSPKIGATSEQMISEYVFLVTGPTTSFQGVDNFGTPVIIDAENDSVGIFVNGAALVPGVDFSVQEDEFTLTNPVDVGDVVTTVIISPPDIGPTAPPPAPALAIYTYMPASSTNVFQGADMNGNTLALNTSTQHAAVYVNGARLVTGIDFTPQTNAITLTQGGAGAGDSVTISVMLSQPGVIIAALPPSGVALRAYRYPAEANPNNRDIWLPLPSQYSSVAKSPLANDSYYRLYWTNPGDPGSPYFATAQMLAAGTAPYNLGMVYPDPTQSVITVSASGGVQTPLEGRSYCFTYIDQYGEESATSLPTPVYEAAPDGTWVITGLPTSPPANTTGKNYPAITGLRLYRTASSTSTGGQFFAVDTFTFGGSHPPTSPYTDPVPDTVIASNLPLASGSFANPPAGLDGLINLPGGMLVGFTGNTVHFCEPDRPHTWPVGYDQSMQYPIKGFGVWQQSLVVLTEGFPLTGSGPNPSNFIFTLVRVPEPCISRGSIVTDLAGVYYASQNGIVMLNYFGMTNQTLSIVTKNVWLTHYRAPHIIACRHRSQYLAVNGTPTGFLIDYSEQRLGLMPISPVLGVECVWNDEYSGDAYMIANNIVYRWDSPRTPPLMFRWRSKQFYLPAPISLAAVQVSSDPEIATMVDPGPPPLDNADPTLVLPTGVNAICNIFAGPDGNNLVATRDLMTGRELFRSPAGFMSFAWQVEIISRVGVRSIELGTSYRELKTVG